MIFKVESDFHEAYNLIVYSRTPSYLLGWVPFVSLFASLYTYYLLFLGVLEQYSVTRKKAAAVVLGALIATIALAVVLVLLIYPSAAAISGLAN